jgi:hypothetical protein
MLKMTLPTLMNRKKRFMNKKAFTFSPLLLTSMTYAHKYLMTPCPPEGAREKYFPLIIITVCYTLRV